LKIVIVNVVDFIEEMPRPTLSYHV